MKKDVYISYVMLLICYVFLDDVYQFVVFLSELMLLGLISLFLGQWASVISRICLDSSLFSSKFFLCSKEDFEIKEHITLRKSMFMNETEDPPKGINFSVTHHCGKVISCRSRCMFCGIGAPE